MNNISFRQYRAIDLGIMAVILFASEMLTVYAAGWFPTEGYTLSPTTLVLCLVMMRWDGFAAVHAAVGGLAFCIAVGAEPKQYAVYCIGNCFALAALPLFKILGKEKIRKKIPFTIIYAVVTFCLIQIGRWTVSLFFGGDAGSILKFFAYDSLSLLFAVVALYISGKMDGLFEDQKSYLIRTEDERRRERERGKNYYD